jgi:hypothetical protein
MVRLTLRVRRDPYGTLDFSEATRREVILLIHQFDPRMSPRPPRRIDDSQNQVSATDAFTGSTTAPQE